MVRPVGIAQRLVHAAAAHLQVPATLAGFAQRSASQCAAAVNAVSRPEMPMDLRDDAGWDAAFGLSRFLPVYGDEVLPLHPLAALAKGAGSDVDLLIGTTREEMNIYMVPTGVRAGVSAAAASAMLAASSPCAAELLRVYGLEEAKRPGDALCTAMTDLVFRLPARRFAAAHRGRTHLYEFAWRSPACGGELGACHALELPFVFNTLATCRGPSGLVGENPPEDMAQRVHGIWLDIVSRGHFEWLEYTHDTQQCLMLDSGATVRDEPMPAAAFA
jgi:para-nitrobenzyl esterase